MFEEYLRYEYYVASAQLALAMFGMGATLTPAEFREVARDPKGFWLGMLTVLVLGPLFAIATAAMYRLEPGIATGLILISAVPGGTVSNLLTYGAHGNVALSIALTACATLTCLVSTPLVLEFAAGSMIGDEVVMPAARIAREIVAFLLAPLALGMLLARRFERRRAWFARSGIRASVLMIVVMVIGSAGAGRVDAGPDGPLVLLAVGSFSLGMLLVGGALAWFAGLPRGDGVAIGIEAAYRNTSLALLIKASLFPAIPGVPDPFADQVMLVAIVYAGAALTISMIPLVARRLGGTRV